MPDHKNEPKDSGASFFRKVVKFVANPATDWAELSSATQEEPLQSGYAKSELKAMIERKRRNDFVRKREFDMLRKIRREGLPPDGLAALQGSDLDDSDQPRAHSVARPDDATVKAKIDEIEQQMEGEVIARRSGPSHPPSFYDASTLGGRFDEQAPPMNEPFNAGPPPVINPDAVPLPHFGDTEPAEPPPMEPPSERAPLAWEAPQAPAPVPAPRAPAVVAAAPAKAPVATPPAAAAPPAPAKPAVRTLGGDFGNPFAVEVNEIAHDPELDEAVISFANAEFEACERAITGLIGEFGERRDHAETWLVLFDLYRATAQQQPFESLALDYVQRFGWSAPQWFSIPQLAAEAAVPPAATKIEGNVGWVAPEQIDTDVVAQLRAKTLQMPMPWVLDWNGVRRIDLEACSALSELMRHWSTQKIEMRWIHFQQLLTVLAEAGPTGARDADPALWLLRLETLRLANRPDQFDEVAIDYCVTYEVSPPSWEASQCRVKLSDASGVTINSRAMVTEVSTAFAESQVLEDVGGVKTAAVDLSGQLVGDIGRVLQQLEAQLGAATVVNVNCARLIRMDFVAAGDLLNWVLNRRGENRLIHFDDAHRLLALFFNAMGINEHARVKVRNI